MRRSLISLFFVLLASCAVWADEIHTERALRIAEQFAESAASFGTRAKLPAKRGELQLAHTIKSKSTQQDNVYVINLGSDGGFVIVAGDDRADAEVLGYCDHGSFDYAAAPIQLRYLLEGYAAQIDSVRANAPEGLTNIVGGYAPTPVVGPLLTTKWNQWGPYNMYCPEGCPTGCVITAVAQVMNYWEWPDVGHGSHKNEVSTETVDFSQSHYDWANMADDYADGTSHTAAQQAAVAQLMHDVGVAYDAAYAPEATLAGFSWFPLTEYFRYAKTAKEFSDAASAKKELDEGRPLLYSGHPNEGVGHALVCDGYDDRDYFHFNYGWGGLCDGYYKLGAVLIYSRNYSFIGGIEPEEGSVFDVGDMTYRILPDGSAELKQCHVPDGQDVIVPDVVTFEGKTYPVTRIASGAIPSYLIESGTLTQVKHDRLVVGNNVRTIARRAAMICQIKTVVLGDAVEEVGEEAFNTCGIVTLTLGKSMRRIGRMAFHLCPLATVNCLTENLEVGEEAFRGDGFNFIKDPEWLRCLTKIGRRAFYGRTIEGTVSLDNLTSLGSEAFWDDIDELRLPACLRHIAPDAFGGCRLYKLTVDPANPLYAVQTGGYAGFVTNKAGTRIVCAFMHPANGNFSITVPDGVVSIDVRAFYKNTKSVTIPPSVVSMDGAFAACDILSRVILKSINPPVVSPETFNEALFADGGQPDLHIPDGCWWAYHNDPVWGRFRLIEDLTYSPQAVPAIPYNMVVHLANGQGISKPISDIGQVTADGTTVSVDTWSTDAAQVESITWEYDFVPDQSETFVLNDSVLTAEALDCTVTLDPTVISGETVLQVRPYLNCPARINGALQGKAFEVSLGDDIHELTGTIEIRVPMELPDGQKACAAWYNHDSGEWEPVCGVYDIGRSELVITTSHLSTFGCFTVEDELTARAHINISNNINDFVLPELDVPFAEIAGNMSEIINAVEPGQTGFDLYADQLGTVLGLGNDFALGLSASAAKALGYNTKFAESVNENLGYLGAALSVYQLLNSAFQRDEEKVAVNAMRVGLNAFSIFASKTIATTALSASMAAVAFLDYSLMSFGQAAIDLRKDQYQRGFDNYYATRGKRSAVDWYNKFYPLFSREDLSEKELKSLIEQEVHTYARAFWNLPADEQVEFFEEAYKWGPVSGQGLTEAIRTELSSTLENNLYNGTLVSVFQAIKKHKMTEAHQEAFKAFKATCRQLNQQVKVKIFDSKRDYNDAEWKSEYEGCKVCIGGTTGPGAKVSDPDAWSAVIDKDGHAEIFYTVYASILAEPRPEVHIYDTNDELICRFPYEVEDLANYGAPSKLVAQIDLQDEGEKLPPTDEWSFTITPQYTRGTVDGVEKEMMFNLDLRKPDGDSQIGLFDAIKEALSADRSINPDKEGNFTITTDAVTLTGTIDPRTKQGTATFTLNAYKFWESPVSQERYIELTAKIANGYDPNEEDLNQQYVGWHRKYEVQYQIAGEVQIGYSERMACYVLSLTGDGTFNFDGLNAAPVFDFDEERHDGTFYKVVDIRENEDEIRNGHITMEAYLYCK